MPYVITWFQNEGTSEVRKTFRPIHLDHIINNAHRIIASGGLFSDNGDNYTGGLVILDTDIKQEAIDFIESDPFFINGIFSSYTIHRWKKAIFDYQRTSI
ncbi:YciI family protein [Bradyrhizobium sp. WSM2254]|uniref:YciI family protein n=1 Tax=Bradyrhizobium sp. WSM2254 TaxID=1188263 RepID=UPI00041DE62C|nr:YciI family protein [Bradyrhizobium sp. WSM2254]